MKNHRGRPRPAPRRSYLPPRMRPRRCRTTGRRVPHLHTIRLERAGGQSPVNRPPDHKRDFQNRGSRALLLRAVSRVAASSQIRRDPPPIPISFLPPHFRCFMPGDLALRRGDDIFDVEAEFLLKLLQRRRSSKGLDANVVPFRACIFAPAEIGSLLDRYARPYRRGENGVAVALVLGVEQRPGRHTDYSRADAVFRQLLISFEAQCNLAPGADENDLRGAVFRIGKNVSPACEQ
jgi:hypothetical protein